MRAGVRKGGAAARAHFLLKMHASTPRSYGAFSAVHRRAAENARLHPSTRRLRVDAWVHTSSLFTFFAVAEKGLVLVLFTRSFLPSGRMEREVAVSEIGSCDVFFRRPCSFCAANFFCI